MFYTILGEKINIELILILGKASLQARSDWLDIIAAR